MRILLVAYDFPPERSPRALRWRYLTRELALLGHEVHVMVPDLGEPGVAFPQAPGRVVVHRIFPGPYGLVVRTARRRHASAAADAVAGAGAGGTVALNWKGRTVGALKRLAGLVLFPDVRAEWSLWARPALRRLLAQVRPQVVITSHEPASTLPLGLYARQRGFPWVADLGDPVCAPYTPVRWRRRALALEAAVCRHADHVLVTNEAARALLAQRHGHDPRRCSVLSNGYDDRRATAGALAGDVDVDPDRLELVYAGRLYGYRDPTPLLKAVAATPGVRLTLVVPDPPTGGAAAIAAAAGEQVRTFGAMPHAQVLRLQEAADVLVNVGNRGLPAQIPAKLYEYLGIGRPILHLDGGPTDAAARLLRDLDRGWICDDEAGALAGLLAKLQQRKRSGTLHEGLRLDPVAGYAHSALGRRLAALLEGVARGAPDGS